jgi:hypothetical protein
VSSLSSALWGQGDTSLHAQQQDLQERLWLTVNPPGFSTEELYNHAPSLLK